MSAGDIAGLIAAVVFAILVGFLAVPLWKLGKVLDATTVSIKELTDETTPILKEATTTISETNRQLARVDQITESVSEATSNVSALIALFAATLGGPLIKLAGFTAGVRAAFTGLRGATKGAKPKR